MRVKELIAALSKFEGDLEVLCSTEDGQLLPPDHGFRLFEVNGASAVEAEWTRDENDFPSLKFGRSPAVA